MPTYFSVLGANAFYLPLSSHRHERGPGRDHLFANLLSCAMLSTTRTAVTRWVACPSRPTRWQPAGERHGMQRAAHHAASSMQWRRAKKHEHVGPALRQGTIRYEFGVARARKARTVAEWRHATSGGQVCRAGSRAFGCGQI
jgi:hypothetical protein